MHAPLRPARRTATSWWSTRASGTALRAALPALLLSRGLGLLLARRRYGRIAASLLLLRSALLALVCHRSAS